MSTQGKELSKLIPQMPALNTYTFYANEKMLEFHVNDRQLELIEDHLIHFCTAFYSQRAHKKLLNLKINSHLTLFQAL